MTQYIDKYLDESLRVAKLQLELKPTFLEIANQVLERVLQDGTVFFCGNGGSAADAQHLVAELLVRLKPMNNRKSIPAITLAQDSSTITACANDFGYDVLFERTLSSLGKRKDVLLAITTSGNSENVYLALQKAKEMEITTIGFLGGNGGKCLSLCDYSFLAPSDITSHIQEAHITAGHIIMDIIERSVCPEFNI